MNFDRCCGFAVRQCFPSTHCEIRTKSKWGRINSCTKLYKRLGSARSASRSVLMRAMTLSEVALIKDCASWGTAAKLVTHQPNNRKNVKYQRFIVGSIRARHGVGRYI